jgi:murein L,D-transpeptidase YcbB/YkuD
MGRVKLNFRPLYFLHGTPDDSSIGTASSHGCVRMHNADAIALAVAVMRAGVNGADSSLPRIVADTVTTSTWLLDRPVPLAIVSRSVEIERDSVFWYPNPYGDASARVAEQLFTALRTLAPWSIPDSAAISAFAATADHAKAVPLRNLLRKPR